MILVYNEIGLQDTLLCIIQGQQNLDAIQVKKEAEFTVLMQNDVVVGVNIPQAKTLFPAVEKIDGILLERNYALEEELLTYLSIRNGVAITSQLQQQFVIGYVAECSPHPDSEKLSVCIVDVATEKLQIVCGATNIAQGQKVVVAKIGSMMPNGLIIQPSVLRKVESNGMICSAKELNIQGEYQPKGILVLSPDAPIGAEFFPFFVQEMGQ